MATNNAQDIFNAYMAVINPSVIEKTDPDSIDPVDVGGIAQGLQAFITLWEKINLQDITQDDPDPIDADGEDGDLYYQNLINGFRIWRKEGGAWVIKVTINNSLNVPDGVVSGLRSYISGFLVTVESGGWVIANVIYRKDTQTQFTLSAADLNWGRYDLIYANNANQVLLLEGTASITPAIPTLPANSIIVDIAFIPSVASGAQPYLLYGNNTSSGIAVTVTGVADASGEYDASGDGIDDFPNATIYDSSDDVSTATYNSTTKIIKFLVPSAAFTAKFR